MKRLLIIVDMQNDFIFGSLKNEEAIKIVDKVKEKVISAIENKDNLIFTRDTHFDDYLETLEGKKLPVKHCIKNTIGWQIINQLSRYSEYMNVSIVDKFTFGYTGWNKLINVDEINEIELVGVCTDICVVSNAIILRAMYPNLRIIVDSTCCAGTTIERHNSTLEVLKSCQIEVF